MQSNWQTEISGGKLIEEDGGIIMSEFSGKCDFCDWINDQSDEYIQNCRFYIHGKGRDHKLDIQNKQDAIKYYPYIVGLAASDQNGAYICLSSECFIDTEEGEHLQWQIEDVLRYWRKCKRDKKKFDIDEAYTATNFWDGRTDYPLKQIIERVAEKGDKATFEGIHLHLHEYYRKKWYEYMVQNGYDEHEAYCWVYKTFMPSDEEISKRIKGGSYVDQ